MSESDRLDLAGDVAIFHCFLRRKREFVVVVGAAVVGRLGGFFLGILYGEFRGDDVVEGRGCGHAKVRVERGKDEEEEVSDGKGDESETPARGKVREFFGVGSSGRLVRKGAPPLLLGVVALVLGIPEERIRLFFLTRGGRKDSAIGGVEEVEKEEVREVERDP